MQRDLCVQTLISVFMRGQSSPYFTVRLHSLRMINLNVTFEARTSYGGDCADNWLRVMWHIGIHCRRSLPLPRTEEWATWGNFRNERIGQTDSGQEEANPITHSYFTFSSDPLSFSWALFLYPENRRNMFLWSFRNYLPRLHRHFLEDSNFLFNNILLSPFRSPICSLPW